MSRKALSYLLLLLIALQSVTAMADVHPINYSDTAPYSSDFIDGSSSGVLDSSTATDPTDRDQYKIGKGRGHSRPFAFASLL